MRKTLEEELGFEKELGQFVRIFPTYSERHGYHLYIARCPYCARQLNLYQTMNGLSVPIDDDALVFLFCSTCKEIVSYETGKNKTEIVERSWHNYSNYRSTEVPYAAITKHLVRTRHLVRAFHYGFRLPVIGVKPSRVPIQFTMSVFGAVIFLNVPGGVA